MDAVLAATLPDSPTGCKRDAREGTNRLSRTELAHVPPSHPVHVGQSSLPNVSSFSNGHASGTSIEYQNESIMPESANPEGIVGALGWDASLAAVCQFPSADWLGKRSGGFM